MEKELFLKNERRFTQVLRDEEGLTLVELLATVVILAIISTIGAVAIGSVIQNSREDSAVASIQQAYSAAKIYQASPDNKEATDFKLSDLVDEGYLDDTPIYEAAADAMEFTVNTDGNLEITSIPAGALKAGQKTNAAVGGPLDAEAVSGLTRTEFTFS